MTAGIVAELRQTLDKLIAETDASSLTAPARRNLEGEIRAVINHLGGFLNDLDPIRQPTSVFDPGNPKIVGRFIALALVAQPRHPLSEIVRCYGSGVYAIYYTGGFALYTPLSGTETPIYVGQAAPATNNARTPIEQGEKLCRRLEEHRRSIARADTTLRVEDFQFRSLVVQSGWETAAEDYLIHLFRPIWNNETSLVFGLGKHGDAAETRANKRSPWDTLHPGRQWAADTRLDDAKTPQRIADEIADHFGAHRVFPTIDLVLANFIDELRQV